MKCFVMTRTTRYQDSGETYTWANVYRTRMEAHRALTQEMLSCLDSYLDPAEDYDPIHLCLIAYHKGEAERTHNAILVEGDMEFFGDIFETEINTDKEMS